MTGIPDGPFPVPAPPNEQREWVDAGLNTPGVNTAREALESFAPFVVDLKGMLTAPDRDGKRRFTESALRNVHTEAGEMLVAVVRMHGAGGSVWEYNERISSSWHSLANPAALREEERSLSHVRPYTRVKSDGSEEILAAVESVTASREVLVANLEKAAKELSQREGSRPYDLEQDLILNGQQEPGLYLAQHVRIEEPPLRDSEGNFRHPTEHWHWMAVRGNNRTERRQRIYGVTSAEVLAGMPVKRIGGDGEQIIFDPNIWLTRLSELLNAEYAMYLKHRGREGNGRSSPSRPCLQGGGRGIPSRRRMPYASQALSHRADEQQAGPRPSSTGIHPQRPRTCPGAQHTGYLRGRGGP